VGVGKEMAPAVRDHPEKTTWQVMSRQPKGASGGLAPTPYREDKAVDTEEMNVAEALLRIDV
jgi:hypothetical protein